LLRFGVDLDRMSEHGLASNSWHYSTHLHPISF
jgi:hypothetical protein